MFLNNQERRIKVAVGSAKVILILRQPNTSEYTQFIGVVSSATRTAEQNEAVATKRIAYVDNLLTGIEAEDEEGNPDVIQVPNLSGPVELNTEMEGWKDHVRDDWKLAASFTLEGRFNAEEENTLKNS